MFFSQTGRLNDSVGAGQPTIEAATQAVRVQQAGVTSAIANSYLAYHPIGVLFTDAIHFLRDGKLGYWETNRRMGLSVSKQLTGTGISGFGPKAVGTASRSGAVITLPIDLNGAASIAGTALTSWQVAATTDTGFATLLPISSVAVSGSNVVITLASAPSGPVRIRNYYGARPDDSAWVIGTYADASTIPMAPVCVPIVTAS
jgi:hypothetical protein